MKIKQNKITILALHLGTGGIEKYLSSFCKMMENDFEIELVSTYKLNDFPSFNFSNKIKIKYLIDDFPRKEQFKESVKNKRFLRTIKYGFQLFKILLLKYIRNIQYIKTIDSKYIFTTRSFHNKLVGRYKKNNTVTIASEHNYHDNSSKYIRKVCNSVKNIDYLILVSSELFNFYSNKLKKTKCIYIPNVIDDIPNYSKKKKFSNKLITVGRLVDEKGYEDLIDIISLVKQNKTNIVLDIYGDGPLFQKLKNKIIDMKLENSVYLKGFVGHDELLSMLNEYDIYLMSSYTESFGLVLIEAMSNSLPCIAFDSANGAKTLLDGGRGVLIANRDKKEYADSIIKLYSNLDLINQLTSKAYESIKKYNINNVKKDWYKKIFNLTK